MLEKDPSKRYPKAADAHRDLSQIAIEEESFPSTGPSLGSAVRRLLPAILTRPQDRK